MIFTKRENAGSWAGEAVYDRVRFITVAVPAVGVLLLLGLALAIDREVSTVGAVAIAGGITLVGTLIFSRLVFAIIEPLRKRLVDQNEELIRTTERLRAIYEASVKITSDLSLSAVLEDVVNASRKVVGARYGALAVIGENGEISEFITSGLSPEEALEAGRAPHGRGLIGHVIRTGKPYRVANITADPRAAGFPAGHPRMNSFLGMPLNYKGKTIGNLYLTDKEDGDFTDEDEEAIRAFAVQAAIAIENARLYEQVQEVAVLEERERIGMDLHDGTIQALYGVGLKLEDCISRVESEPAEVREDLDGAIERINDIIRDIRNYIFDLRPLKLQGTDLVHALREIIEETKVNSLIDVQFSVDDEQAADSLSEFQASQIFAIAHEAMANVRKHSQATSVNIGIETAGGRLRMVISDNGRGISPERKERATGRGLGNMAERAASLQGSFTIDSQPGKGTTLMFEIPIHVRESEQAAI